MEKKKEEPITKPQKKVRSANPVKYDLLLDVASMVSTIEKMERYGIVASTLNACEAVSGVMADVINGKETDLQIKCGRYFLAIRDIMQLCRLVNEIVEMKNDLVKSPTIKWEELVKDVW